MPTTKSKNTNTTEALKQIHYLAAALKPPRITESAARLADHARDAGWTHEIFAAILVSLAWVFARAQLVGEYASCSIVWARSAGVAGVNDGPWWGSVKLTADLGC